MQQSLIAVLAVLIVGGGVFWYNQTYPVVENDFTLAASMICADESHFIAEFVADNKVNVIVDGVTVRTVSQTSEAPMTFEDASYKYVFAGEEAVVTAKANGKMTTCTQPVDPNLAPVNFGDAGEGGGSANLNADQAFQAPGSKPELALIVTENLQGKWQSTTDAKFVREFKVNDEVIDWYDNESVSTGKWVVFTKATAPEVPYPLEANTAYIQMTVTGTQADTLYFKVVKVTPDALELIYLDRGGVLSFKAI